MKKISAFVHQHTHSSSSDVPAVVSPMNTSFPEALDVLRYRKHRGVNLGSWFVLEKWISHVPFAETRAPGAADLDVARMQNAKEVLEKHWDTWITEKDFVFMTGRGINAVRLPIGYYHLCGVDASVISGTDFAGLDHVFAGAWARITLAIRTAAKYGIGVLIDLHAAPGKQNADPHAGTSGTPAFFAHKKHQQHTIAVLRTLLQQLITDGLITNVIGLELLNEPAPPDHGALETWYRAALADLRAIVPALPIVIGDAWAPERFAQFVKGLGAGGVGMVLDHHLYRCFTGEDIHKSAETHAREVAETGRFAGIKATLEEVGAGLIVGEWSAALNPGSLQGANETHAKRAFVHAQLDRFEKDAAGWFFWTYRKEQGGDTGWGWRDAVDAGVFPPWVGLRAQRDAWAVEERAARDMRRDQAKDGALAQHAGYWDQYPGEYEHWRFGDGFKCGWDDAYRLFESAKQHGRTDEIGMTGAWAKRRALGHVREHGEKCLWEFEHGVKQAIEAARKDLWNITVDLDDIVQSPSGPLLIFVSPLYRRADPSRPEGTAYVHTDYRC